MRIEAVSAIMLIVLLSDMLTLGFNAGGALISGIHCEHVVANNMVSVIGKNKFNIIELSSTVRYAIIMSKDTATDWKWTPESLFYALQPADFYNCTDVTYNDLFLSENKPKYSMIYIQRGAPYGDWSSMENWILWAHGNGTSIFMHYDAYQIAKWKQEWFNNKALQNKIYYSGQNIEVLKTNFTNYCNFTLQRTSGQRIMTIPNSELASGMHPLSRVNSTHCIAIYRDATGNKGRFVWWGDKQQMGYPIYFSTSGIYWGSDIISSTSYNPKGHSGEFFRLYMNSLYWCANAPIVKALPTRSLRNDDHFAATPPFPNQDAFRFEQWLLYYKSKGLPYSNAQASRHHNQTEPDNNTTFAMPHNWRMPGEGGNSTHGAGWNITGEDPGLWANVVLKYWLEGWVEITSHGWSHFGADDTPNEFDEKYEYKNASGGFNIYDRLFWSRVELAQGAQSLGYDFQPSDIQVLTIPGNSQFGNRTAHAMYEVEVPYTVCCNFWSGYLFPNGTTPNGRYVVDESSKDVYLVMAGPHHPLNNETQLASMWKGMYVYSIPCDGYLHPSGGFGDGWFMYPSTPEEYLDVIDSAIKNSSWQRVLWIEHVGEYSKKFYEPLFANWTAFTMTWDGKTININNNLSVDYLVRVPFNEYVSTVTINSSPWYVHNDNEVYIPASANSVSIGVASDRQTATPHVQAVRRASISVTSCNYVGNQFNVTIDGIKGLFAELEINCGELGMEKGAPTTVVGASSYNYDADTNILSLNTTAFSNLLTVIVEWEVASELNIEDTLLPYTEHQIYVDRPTWMPSYNIGVTVTNQGTADAGCFNVSFISYLEGEIMPEYGRRQTVEMLEQGINKTLAFDFNPQYYGNYTLTITVDCDNDIVELDETNNVKIVWLIGTISCDMNCNGDVDSFDFSIFSGNYGSMFRSPPYSIADVDWDGDVDSFDFYLFSGKYGQSI